jgi:hypothetical protein
VAPVAGPAKLYGVAYSDELHAWMVGKDEPILSSEDAGFTGQVAR